MTKNKRRRGDAKAGRARRKTSTKPAPVEGAGQGPPSLSDRLKQIRDDAGECQISRPPDGTGATLRPPPIPKPGQKKADERPADDTGDFGEAAEDGLRMIAALETLPSLEPDCTDILIAEAAVMIVERASPAMEDENARGTTQAPAGSLRARLRDADEAPEIDVDEYAAYHSHVEEATIEIVEPEGDEEANLEPMREGRLPTVRRFFKALTGGD